MPKKHKLASLETLFVSRFASHSTKVKTVFQQSIGACEIWRSFLHLLGMFYFSHKLICFYKFDCSHRQVFPEVRALMEMLAVSCPHSCDFERANSLVKLNKDERSNRLTPQSLFHKLLMKCNGPDFHSFNESDLPKRIARFWLFYHKRRVNTGVLQPPTSEEQEDWMQMDNFRYDFTKLVQQVS